MKIIGILATVLGVLLLGIGLVVCVVTLTSDYSSKECARVEADKPKFEAAFNLCRDRTSECYKTQTIGLTTQSDCDNRKSFMRTQLIMGIVPALFGFLLAAVGIFVFFFARKRAVRQIS